MVGACPTHWMNYDLKVLIKQTNDEWNVRSPVWPDFNLHHQNGDQSFKNDLRPTTVKVSQQVINTCTLCPGCTTWCSHQCNAWSSSKALASTWRMLEVSTHIIVSSSVICHGWGIVHAICSLPCWLYIYMDSLLISVLFCCVAEFKYVNWLHMTVWRILHATHIPVETASNTFTRARVPSITRTADQNLLIRVTAYSCIMLER